MEWYGTTAKKTDNHPGGRRASSITVNSKEAYNACINYGKPAKNIYLIRYPGVDLSRFYPIDKGLVKKYISENAQTIVFWPRGIADYLNFDTLIAASQIVLKRYTDIHFIILFANKEEVDVSITEELKAKGIEKNYSLLNKLQFEDMPYYYSAAHMTISISSNDSLPNTMLEAMACGCPVIMGDIPQIRDWVIDGNGYLCPVKDADKLAECIMKVIEDPQEMNEKFIQENLTLIKQEVDSCKMSAEIKQLVVNISSKKPETE